MDSSVTPLRHGGLSLVQTTDFFYPLVDDPYMMGKSRTHHLSLGIFALLLSLVLLSFRQNRLCKRTERSVRDGSDRMRQRSHAAGSQHEDDGKGARCRGSTDNERLQRFSTRSGHNGHRRPNGRQSLVYYRRCRYHCLPIKRIHCVSVLSRFERYFIFE